jgi:hypothetical protein
MVLNFEFKRTLGPLGVKKLESLKLLASYSKLRIYYLLGDLKGPLMYYIRNWGFCYNVLLVNLIYMKTTSSNKLM